jgi:hypothetical protein
MDKIHLDLQFKATYVIDNTINFLDLLITRDKSKLPINIYRKPTTTDTTIHYKSNHPLQYKISNGFTNLRLRTTKNFIIVVVNN